MSPLNRRTFLGSAGALGAAVGLDALPAVLREASAAAAGGTLDSVEHVVILMQENRSFDHYYGTLRGVRGFADTSRLRFPSNAHVFQQKTLGAAGGSVLQPWHLDTATTDAQRVSDLDHSWSGTHSAWNNGLYNNWIPAKTAKSMGYYTRADIPWQFALADAFTLCDQYFCSVQGPTNPNRLYQWSGWVDPNGTAGGPVTDNSEKGYGWTTYPERLEAAGVAWRVYQETDNYDDNPLAWFTRFKNAATSSSLYQRGMLKTTDSIAAFAADVAAGKLPQVSWVVAPAAKSEHPSYPPAYGADYSAGILAALAAHPDVWAKTVVFLNFDENDGFFDHVVPPVAPSGTADEFIGGKPIGLGPRVPMTVISPWSTGGKVCSETFDHGSVLRFVEAWTGVKEPNVSAWRRTVCGDLTSAFAFATTPSVFPGTLPDTKALVAKADAQNSLPDATAPASSTLPPQESGDRPALPLGYRFDTTSWTDAATGRIWFKTTGKGRLGGGFAAYTVNHRAFQQWRYTCAPGGSISDYFSAQTYGGGLYDVDLMGPDGYVRGFQGDVRTWSDAAKAHPEAQVTDDGDGASLTLQLTNSGGAAAVFTIGANTAQGASGGSAQTVTVAAGGSWTGALRTAAGRYDVTVTANTGDGFARRFAGRVYQN
ncbi:phospholipase C, phosphocholine-specific [Streptomyces sp. SID8381]|uniref:phosphocholine-specific phospholipase C n=1 Tax=unclassified Streptomyces TaxID=2593676 RepID=UPI00037D943D|nr:phospholipase C, phosphocholine-specific [Streptomyces sp. Amel2xE9]MYX25128.1 phospholipase C, phosphocholine-specific [Streptomyces sp. SID8381]